MKTNNWIWAVWALVLLCYVVPYGFLTEVQSWSGSFIYWTITGVLVVVANLMITKDFGEEEA
ncbi:hypothetical protein [Oceanobacter kriegii]|uniref:hypothetical protein n=1 Tax=Oceanobacter kriegii TaxID=64972 RepID=UPI0003FDD9DB|nr:hypothetical protein [Oceanobacter kriegii]